MTQRAQGCQAGPHWTFRQTPISIDTMRAIRKSTDRHDGPKRTLKQGPLGGRLFSLTVCIAALVVGYLLLTRFVPMLSANLGSVPRSVDVHWSAPVWSVAATVNSSRSVALGAIALAGSTAVLLTVISRPTAVLVYLAGICLCVLDLVILLGALTYFYGRLLDEVM